MCLLSTSFVCLPPLQNRCAICMDIYHILLSVFPDLVFQLTEVITEFQNNTQKSISLELYSSKK